MGSYHALLHSANTLFSINLASYVSQQKGCSGFSPQTPPRDRVQLKLILNVFCLIRITRNKRPRKTITELTQYSRNLSYTFVCSITDLCFSPCFLHPHYFFKFSKPNKNPAGLRNRKHAAVSQVSPEIIHYHVQKTDLTRS